MIQNENPITYSILSGNARREPALTKWPTPLYLRTFTQDDVKACAHVDGHPR